MTTRLLPNITLGLLALALAACTEGNTAEPRAGTADPRPRPVVVEVVRLEARTPSRTFVGTVRPRVESDLGFRVAGKLSERLVSPGDRVTRGQVLMRLDRTDLNLTRDQAVAEHRAAQVNLDQAQAQERRAVDLRRNGWTTDATVERTLAATAEARSRLDRAERQLALASNQLDYAELVADSDGVVTATLAEPGQVLAAGAPVVRLARAGDREAVVAIPETLVDRVRTVDATVTLWSRPGEPVAARLRELAASADPASRTFQARFTMANADHAEIGMTATVAITEPSTDRIARLPVSALFAQGDGASVWVVDPDRGALTLTPVQVAGFDGRDVLISRGLQEGQRVVSLGVQKLDAAQTVRIVESRG